jgi:hypothetical protein
MNHKYASVLGKKLYQLTTHSPVLKLCRRPSEKMKNFSNYFLNNSCNSYTSIRASIISQGENNICLLLAMSQAMTFLNIWRFGRALPLSCIDSKRNIKTDHCKL